jgi:pimeloyl-ACP methyl ester carboxylesterase
MWANQANASAGAQLQRASICDRPIDEGIDRQFRLADGRRLNYREYGAPGGFPVLALHGTPGSRLKYAAAAPYAARMGLRIISPDRWGYGRTDAHPDPTLALYARDAAELVAGLKIGRFSVVGISGGGPYATAVAALLSEQVKSLALVAPVGPIAGLLDKSELRLFHQLCFRILGRTPAIGLAFGIYRILLTLAPRATIRVVSLGAEPVDKALVRSPDVRDRLGETFRAGFERGVQGTVLDMRLFSRPWELPLDRISARTRIWLGTHDKNIPQAAARMLHRLIGRAELSELQGQGHFWISRNYQEVVRWLAEGV